MKIRKAEEQTVQTDPRLPLSSIVFHAFSFASRLLGNVEYDLPHCLLPRLSEPFCVVLLQAKRCTSRLLCSAMKSRTEWGRAGRPKRIADVRLFYSFLEYNKCFGLMCL